MHQGYSLYKHRGHGIQLFTSTSEKNSLSAWCNHPLSFCSMQFRPIAASHQKCQRTNLFPMYESLITQGYALRRGRRGRMLLLTVERRFSVKAIFKDFSVDSSTLFLRHPSIDTHLQKLMFKFLLAMILTLARYAE